MKKFTLMAAVVIAVLLVIVLPFFILYYFWLNPLEQKRKDLENFENLCREWNSTGCAGNPTDALCKSAAGKVTLFHLDTKKCSDINSYGIQFLKTACCGK